MPCYNQVMPCYNHVTSCYNHVTPCHNHVTPCYSDTLPRVTLTRYIDPFPPFQAREFLELAWGNCQMAMSCLYPFLLKSTFTCPTDIFFITKLLVMPPKYRPIGITNGMYMEHESSLLLKVRARVNTRVAVSVCYLLCRYTTE